MHRWGLTPWLAAAAVLFAGPAEGEEATEATARERMVAGQIASGIDGRRPVRDPAVLDVMRRVPRHLFVPEDYRHLAYADQPLPIGQGQTISQPYVVGLMTELAQVRPGMRVLEIGTGSGYQAAVLASLTDHVYSIEILEPLAREAAARLEALGYRVQVRAGDGFLGWPEAAPFDAILVTAAVPQVPGPLIEQLAPGGRLVAPVATAEGAQELTVFLKTERGLETERVIPVRFVPMTGLVEQGAGAP